MRNEPSENDPKSIWQSQPLEELRMSSDAIRERAQELGHKTGVQFYSVCAVGLAVITFGTWGCISTQIPLQRARILPSYCVDDLWPSRNGRKDLAEELILGRSSDQLPLFRAPGTRTATRLLSPYLAVVRRTDALYSGGSCSACCGRGHQASQRSCQCRTGPYSICCLASYVYYWTEEKRAKAAEGNR